ncbi:hypothetical protein CQW49_03650 [Methylosinus trichosporium OB3b]|uniref:Uncharacterized protein n=1 Tax=Methylosinus trichosporium (strain ATCC 35070 / NCIMB 11131 / UNIQEM 75 / OB3b) TaxID=595536 RepID=A0A2D2CWC4_METT3|nr:hypothetical protein CQW49_03650 [Methylosinus trichosporium OB3b]OBS51082.1 hypothetical protein A8B73_18095 [Methylosinus sp. 3S-1]
MVQTRVEERRTAHDIGQLHPFRSKSPAPMPLVLSSLQAMLRADFGFDNERTKQLAIRWSH